VEADKSASSILELMPEADDEVAQLRNRLADELFAGRNHWAGQPQGQNSGPVEAAFRQVSRHLFLPGVDIPNAYEDAAIVTLREADGRPLSSSSQPLIMAIMLEQLGVSAGDNVLEIGAGTGFNAALLARIVGDTGHVTTVDIDEEIVANAREHLRSAGSRNVTVAAGDGADGHAANAPYDRIILSVAAADIPQSWTDQLAPAGRLVLPLSLRGSQRSVAFEHAGDHLASVSVVDCGFMPLRGSLAGAAPPIRLIRGVPPIFLVLDDDRHIDTAAIADALEAARDEPPTAVDTGVSASVVEVMGGLGLWLVLRDPDAGQLTALGCATQETSMPAFTVDQGFMRTVVLVGEDELAALVSLDDQTGAGNALIGALPVQQNGGDGSALALRLAAHVRDWDRAGRPKTGDLRISVYSSSSSAMSSLVPPQNAASGARSRFVITKPQSRFVIDW
jgi:protein-L-isoaspartate(D-aspartate) O-methyltransferase